MSDTILRLKNGFNFSALFEIEGLHRLDEEFLARLRAADAGLHATLLAYRRSDHGLTPIQVSALLLGCAPLLEEFIAELFGIEAELAAARAHTLAHDPVFEFKKQFVQRRARRRLARREEIEDFAALDRWLESEIGRAGLDPADKELATAAFGRRLLADAAANADAIEKLTRWCIRALAAPEGRRAVRGWASFHLPQPTDHANLVPLAPADDPAGRRAGPPAGLRRRDGFRLTDPRMDARAAQDEVHYCIYCHDHDGDFCSKGFPEKKGEPDKGLKLNPLGVTLTGCPLDQKISEMHVLKQRGLGIAALAMITVDNPMCAVTGHRICNDCMKACIYQKQDPVNIPQTETRILTDVLDLPWGVEIYDLLIRWNPLRPRQWRPKPYNGLKVLVCGQGPAGFTLAHHLLMEGCAVVGVDGLKIEPLPRALVDRPIRDYSSLREALDSRTMAGFGGVAEYGITNRWDKNFLKLIYLSLLRRERFQLFGGVRFGGTVTVEEAWRLGFDHVTVAVGAGLPQALKVEGSLAPGMRQANDFLMALQLTGAAKKASLANLQVRLPAVVIGGGLTGVDTATEVQAYYILQVEKILERHEILVQALGEAHIRAPLDEASRAILDEFLTHGRAVRAERARAAAAGEAPDFVALVRRWGGVTIAYRRGLNESPAYIRNHEEIVKALEEGIYYAEGLSPKAARLDRHGHVEAMVFQRQARGEDGAWRDTGDELALPARAIFVATGARPNVAYEFEHKGHFLKEKGHYQTHHETNGALEPVPVAPHCKTGDFGLFTSYHEHDRRVSFIGDTHPVFHGSVVKAVASARRAYPEIIRSLGGRADRTGDDREYREFRARMQELFEAKVERVRRVSPSVVELVVRAPLAAGRFQPGQFFRLQNFETQAPAAGATRLQTEALAITGAGADPATGRVTLLVIERGASSRLCAALRVGEPVVLMGPTGVRTDIPDGGATVMVVGGRHGAAHIRAVGPALRAKGNRVLFFAAFPDQSEVFCRDELEAATDAVVWCTARGAPIAPRRPQDRAATGEIVDVILRYAGGQLGGAAPIRLEEVTHLMIIGGSGLVRRLRDARGAELRAYFPKPPETVASISTPMQCCLKGVCAQCLQWQIDPVTGRRTKAVFSCSWQDQPLDIVDLDNLDERLSQNRLQEHLANLWLDHLFERYGVERV
ncbi:MAG: pyridine nucleotide-disulfide oxidoreductase [Candidatus Muproteobacteria bacterium RBG_16_65_31]|uniref:Pyridine nucleotide-disulfide oxidoreductase n=1 Tax=Candidatus Muproteobacteria bacterium RBG_16_65_31 TaxID=1817759 RepID=A0A1F6TCR5_9PROT|nr:MAG: pyridine nucleotide-disulfide oxidoreductase [Candidatus Muproteobacteria bacterium RBG_16_65_31]